MAGLRDLNGIFWNTQKRVRTEFNGETVASAKSAMLHRESSYQLHYYFLDDEVHWGFLEKSDKVEESGFKGRQQFYLVRVGDKVAENAAWTFPDEPPNDKRPDLRGYVAFNWRAMDAWYEEDEQVYVHPRDPFHRIDIIQGSRHVRIEANGVTVAESDRPTLLFETGLPVRYYIPLDDVNTEYMESTDLRTGCPYKGFASYWTVNVDGGTHENVAWAYQEPLYESRKIKGLVSFYNEKLDFYVDDELQAKPKNVFS